MTPLDLFPKRRRGGAELRLLESIADSDSPEYQIPLPGETYYGRLGTQWTVSNMITLTVSGSYRIHRDGEGKSLYQLTPDGCRSFYWKDCMIYSNVPMKPFPAYGMSRAAYREWFPYRGLISLYCARDKLRLSNSSLKLQYIGPNKVKA